MKHVNHIDKPLSTKGNKTIKDPTRDNDDNTSDNDSPEISNTKASGINVIKVSKTKSSVPPGRVVEASKATFFARSRSIPTDKLPKESKQRSSAIVTKLNRSSVHDTSNTSDNAMPSEKNRKSTAVNVIRLKHTRLSSVAPDDPAARLGESSTSTNVSQHVSLFDTAGQRAKPHSLNQIINHQTVSVIKVPRNRSSTVAPMPISEESQEAKPLL